MTSWEKKTKRLLVIVGKGKDPVVPAPPRERNRIHSSGEGRGVVGISVFLCILSQYQSTVAKPCESSAASQHQDFQVKLNLDLLLLAGN